MPLDLVTALWIIGGVSFNLTLYIFLYFCSLQRFDFKARALHDFTFVESVSIARFILIFDKLFHIPVINESKRLLDDTLNDLSVIKFVSPHTSVYHPSWGCNSRRSFEKKIKKKIKRISIK